ncbi:MAG: homocitrate synthase/isopropylmalate synthase family protein, partial [Pyrinomonadaceae bacterium]
LVLGKHSGRHALALRYEDLGYSLTATELDGAYGQFTQLADRKKRIYDQDLISLLAPNIVNREGPLNFPRPSSSQKHEAVAVTVFGATAS